MEDYPNHNPKDEDLIEGAGVTVGEMQAVARRQLAGSIAAGILVVAVAAVLVLRSGHVAAPNYASAHNGVRPPIFVRSSDHVVAAAKHKIEEPY